MCSLCLFGTLLRQKYFSLTSFRRQTIVLLDRCNFILPKLRPTVLIDFSIQTGKDSSADSPPNSVVTRHVTASPHSVFVYSSLSPPYLFRILRY